MLFLKSVNLNQMFIKQFIKQSVFVPILHIFNLIANITLKCEHRKLAEIYIERNKTI